MTMSLYAAIIPSYRQILGAVTGLLDKAGAFCAEKGLEPQAIIQARLIGDMLPFAYQIASTAGHSLGAIEGVRKGVFSPDMTAPPADFAGLRARITAASTAMAALDPAEIDGFIGRDMCFSMGERRMDFTAENFLLSFSQPNFFFHATTAYDILRANGVTLTKRDFLGQPRLKG